MKKKKPSKSHVVLLKERTRERIRKAKGPSSTPPASSDVPVPDVPPIVEFRMKVDLAKEAERIRTNLKDAGFLEQSETPPQPNQFLTLEQASFGVGEDDKFDTLICPTCHCAFAPPLPCLCTPWIQDKKGLRPAKKSELVFIYSNANAIDPPLVPEVLSAAQRVFARLTRGPFKDMSIFQREMIAKEKGEIPAGLGFNHTPITDSPSGTGSPLSDEAMQEKVDNWCKKVLSHQFPIETHTDNQLARQVITRLKPQKTNPNSDAATLARLEKSQMKPKSKQKD